MEPNSVYQRAVTPTMTDAAGGGGGGIVSSTENTLDK